MYKKCLSLIFFLKNEYTFAFLIVLLITVIYLFPAFLGKVDVPIDIRNVQMYPWRYHFVDSKIEKITLWEHEPNSFKLTSPKEGETKFLFNLNFDELLLIKLSNYKRKDLNPYLLLHYKPVNYEKGKDAFEISFTNKIAKKGERLKIKSPSVTTSWYTLYVPLNDLKSIKDLSLYKLEIVAKNPSKDRLAFIYFKNLKIICEDYSKALKVHNPFISELIEWYTPTREYFSGSIKKGILPFWSNFNLTGNELLAEYRVGFFHPLYFLVYLLFDHFTAHIALTFISLLLCGVGVFILTRYWGLTFSTSILTSIVYMFHPFNVTHFSYESTLMCSATLPFLILFYEYNLKENKLLNKNLLLSLILLCLVFLSGEIRMTIFPIIFFFLFTVFRLLQEISFYEKNYLKHLFSIFFVFSFSLMISQLVLFPQFILFQNAFKIEHPEFLINSTSLPIKAFATLLYPYYYGFPEWSYSPISFKEPKLISGYFKNYVYFGFLPFLFSLFSFRMFLKDKRLLFFSSLILLSILISTGSPLYYLFKYFIPGFKYLEHFNFIALYSLSVPFLCGIGFQIFTYFLANLSKGVKFLIYFLLILITTIDLMFYSSYFVTWSSKNDYKKVISGSSIDFLINAQKKSKDPFRILPITSYSQDDKIKVDIAKPNTLLPYGLEELSGNSILIPQRFYNLLVYIQTKMPTGLYEGKYLNVFENYNTPYPIFDYKERILDILNVKYFLVPKNLELESGDIKKVYEGDSIIYENLNCLPRAFVALDFTVINSVDRVIWLLKDEKFNPLNIVILDSVPRVSILGADYSNLPKLKYDLKFIKYEHNKIKLKVKVNRPSILVLGNNLNENWKVKVNGEIKEHYTANLVQRAVFLPKKGNYTVEFYYFPDLFIKGLIITLFTLLLLLLIYIYINWGSVEAAKEKTEIMKLKKLRENLRDLFVRTHNSK